MARGSRRARSYTRDARGRFASTGTTGRKPKPARTTFRQRQAVSLARQRRQTGRLGSATREAKARLKASRRKLGANASPQQKAAVTRAARMAAALAGQRRIKAGPQAGVIRGAAARGVKKAAGVRVRNVRGDGMSKGRPGQLGRALARAEANMNRLGAKKEPSRKLDNGYAVNTEAASLYSRRSRSTSRAANLLPVSLPVNAGKKVVARRMATLRGKAPDTAKGKGKGSGTSRKRVKGEEGAPKTLPAAKVARPQKKKKVDYAGAVRLLSQQKAAIGRLKNPQQTFNGNGAYARQFDIRMAKSTPAANAQREIKALYGEYRRVQHNTKNPYASPEARNRAANKLPALRKQVRKAAQAARAFKPEYSAETNRRFQAAQARRKPKPTHPTSKVAAPGSRRKVKGPKMAGTIAKPKGLKPGALAERRGKKARVTAATPARPRKKKAMRSVTTPERQIVADQLRILRKKLKQDQKDSEKAMARRASLGIGASRARVTTANARWARRAEERDKTIERIDALRERGRKLPRRR